MNYIKLTAVLAAVLLAFTPVWAQGLPELKKSDSIVSGELPDGITYYLIKNATPAGYADFSLVQPGRKGIEDTRRDLVDLPHFSGRQPYRFLASAGVHYSRYGYIQHHGDATVFRFANVPSQRPAITDSTLLLIFDLALSSPNRQAIIISGDIDVPTITDRIRSLSMTIPHRSEESAPQYTWQSGDTLVCTSSTSPIGRVRLTYRAPRTDPELMNTIQPVMSALLSEEFGIILTRRLRQEFNAKELPLADCRYRYTGSGHTAADELYTLLIETDPARLSEAVKTISATLGELDRNGVTKEETFFARNVINSTALREDDIERPTNQEYTDKCISAYLYGYNLATMQTLSGIFARRHLDTGREQELLGRFISPTLDRKRNLRLHFSAPEQPDAAALAAEWDSAWDSGSSPALVPSAADTTKLSLPRSKSKISGTTAEPVSGGKSWTFANGVTVIFKKTKDKGAMHFGYMVRGGWTEIPGLDGDDYSFVGDAVALEKVAGMQGEYFRDLLLMNGITLDSEVTLSDIRYTGKAPANRLSLVLKAIFALASSQETDAVAWKGYMAEESLRRTAGRYSARGVRAVLDSTMAPTYRYSSSLRGEVPGEYLPLNVNTYLHKKGMSSGNTVIMLAGDLDESTVQKLLTSSVGAFGNQRQRIARPKIPYQLQECWSTVSEGGIWRDRGVTMALSAYWPFSSGGNLTLQLACAVLETALAQSIAPLGYSYSVVGESNLLPAETIAIYISCQPVPQSGLPLGVQPAAPTAVLDAVRKTVNRLATEDVSEVEFSLGKEHLGSHMGSISANTESVMSRALSRNALGREVSTASYAERLKTVKPSDVRAVFSSLDATKCEFVVR